ncbi:MAG: tRNA-dihydrouridine synthase family protein [Firmicutes bacterium]|nr:tRNA-dihydrouridine synthase family protein [Bacillota bacterium]
MESYIKSIKLADIKIPNNIFLSPIAGYSDASFREICLSLGAGLCFTEMVSAKGLFYDSQNSNILLKTSKLEKVKAVQIFGNDPEIMREVAETKLKNFDIIDINMGCPVNKIIKNNEGGSLMNNFNLASKIISALFKTKKIITVKFRRGYDKDVSADFGKMCEQSGASLLTLHGRFVNQHYSGCSDFNCIENLVKSVKVPVVANGDIGLDNYIDVFRNTGCAAVMLCRNALADPNIFAYITGRQPYKIKNLILLQLDLMKQNYSEHYAVVNFRKFLPHYLKGRKNNKEIKQKVFSCDSLKDIEQIIKKEI